MSLLREEKNMKWTKIDQRTGEPMKKGCNQFMPHDYVAGDFRIINKAWMEPNGWILTCNGTEIGRFKTLKEAKAKAEGLEPLAEWI